MQTTALSSERRRWKRQIVARACVVHCGSSASFPARTINLSPGGVLLEVVSSDLDGVPLQVGQRLDVEVPLVKGKQRASQIAYAAEVVRLEEREGGDVRIACRSVRARLRPSLVGIREEMPSQSIM